MQSGPHDLEHLSPSKRDTTSLTRLTSLAYYAFASMGAQYFVKFLFSGYGFTFPLTVALLQVVFTVPAAFATMDHTPNWSTAAHCLPLALVHTLNMTAALSGMYF